MIKIVTDSSSYFKKKEADSLSVKVVPINYTVNGANYFETYSDQNGDFENLIQSHSRFATSQPNMSAFLSAFEEEINQGNEVLCITISARLSGTYSSAYMAAKQIENPNVVVFDSQMVAGGLNLLIREAKKLIDSGKSLSEIVKQLPVIRDRITIVFSVDDMAPLRNSGRLGFVRLSIGTILNIKPILLCKEGAVVADGVARGNTEIIKKLLAKMPKTAKAITVNHIGDSYLASTLYNVIQEKYPKTELKLQKMGPVLGIHLGLNVVAVSVLSE